MKLDDYKNLTHTQQKTILNIVGIPIAKRQENYFAYQLYSLDNFYVEICQLNEAFSYIKAFTSVDALDPYLNAINIPF